MTRISTVLLVEDDENDIVFFQRALKKLAVPCDAQVVRSGNEAINYMQGEKPYSNREKHPLPQVIITDGNMPGLSGAEFLQWLRNHPQFRVIPAILMAGGDSLGMVNAAYKDLGIQSFISKPHGVSELQEILRKVFDYWSICKLPALK